MSYDSSNLPPGCTSRDVDDAADISLRHCICCGHRYHSRNELEEDSLCPRCEEKADREVET